jgi:hypothetical protein
MAKHDAGYNVVVFVTVRVFQVDQHNPFVRVTAADLLPRQSFAQRRGHLCACMQSCHDRVLLDQCLGLSFRGQVFIGSTSLWW